MDDGFASLDEAFAATVAEAEQAGSPAPEPAQPPGEGQPDQAAEASSKSPVEQPEPDADGGDELAKAMLDVEDDMDNSDSSDTGPVPGSEEYWAQDVAFDAADGPTTVTLKELTEGYLRHADYTRKTQAVAKEREANQAARGFYDRFTKDPSGFARALATEAGWLEAGDTPHQVKEFASVPTPTDFNEMVEAEVQKRLSEDPRIERDAATQQQRAVDESFAKIEEQHGMSISEELRTSILQEAIDRQVPDLEVIFLARRARALEKQQRASGVRAAAPSRPGVPHAAQTQPTDLPETVETLDDAYKQALAEQQAS